MTTEQRLARLIYFFLAVCLVSILRADSEALATKRMYSPNARIIALELARCPCWTHIRSDEVEFRAGITRLYEGLTKYSKSEIREGIEAYIAAHESDLLGDMDARAKVFALLRVVFVIPPEGVANAEASHIETYGNPVRDGVLDLLWPFALGHNGKLELTGVALTDYSGPGLNPLAEFDAFDGKYLLRKTRQQGQAENH